MRYLSAPVIPTESQETTRERAVRQRLERREELTRSAIDEKRSTDNRERVLAERKDAETRLLNEGKTGVFIWTETKGTGHAFVSIHQPENITIFTYGRFDDLGITPATGEGVLLKLEGDYAKNYLLHELYIVEAKSFKVLDANLNLVLNHFNVLWESSDNLPDSKTATDLVKSFGKVIDQYDLSGNNCTTHSVNAIKISGSSLFNSEFLGVDYSEDFMIPSSLQNYLSEASSSFEMKSFDITDTMKKLHPNKNDTLPIGKAGRTSESLGYFGESLGVLGESSGYSGATVGGSLGSSQ